MNVRKEYAKISIDKKFPSEVHKNDENLSSQIYIDGIDETFFSNNISKFEFNELNCFRVYNKDESSFIQLNYSKEGVVNDALYMYGKTKMFGDYSDLIEMIRWDDITYNHKQYKTDSGNKGLVFISEKFKKWNKESDFMLFYNEECEDELIYIEIFQNTQEIFVYDCLLLDNFEYKIGE